MDCQSEFQTDWGLPAYLTWITLSIYVLPIVALISVYSRICLAVWRSERFNRAVSRRAAARPSTADPSSATSPHRGGRAGQTHRGGTSHQQPSTTVSTAKLKTVKLTLVVVASYVVCYGPFFVAQMWAAWDKDAPFEGMMLADLGGGISG